MVFLIFFATDLVVPVLLKYSTTTFCFFAFACAGTLTAPATAIIKTTAIKQDTTRIPFNLNTFIQFTIPFLLENFNKILLAKIYDERKTKYGSYYQFQRKFSAGKFQTDKQLALDIDLLYKKAYLEYFSKDSSLDFKDIKGIDFDEFSPELVSTCVEILHSYSFEKSKYKNVDILGEFYETVIRDSFKQTKGLFLTHPNIVLFILAALDIENMVCNKLRYPDENSRYRLPFVIDPSCGTGTFLVYYMNYVQKYINENINHIANGDDDVLSFIKRETQGENTYKWVKDFVFGLDIEPVLATACQINQILHGDGSTNIYCSDGLGDFNRVCETFSVKE